MKGSFLSNDWYRVASLKPRLRSHVEIHRQIFRGDPWYIVQDLHSGKYHRVNPASNFIISLMSGRRTVQDLWELACDRYPDDPPTQPEVVHLISQLHTADLIAGDVPPDLLELGRRHYDQSRRSLIARLRNPLAMRFSLLDPDRFLTATTWIVRPLFTVWGFLAWMALVITGIVLAIMNWEPLTRDVFDKVLSGENVLLIVLAFPLIKAVHELGHAYATKVWGGEVHEIGIMLLVLIPVPYVDASSSAAFPEKWRRALVGAAGIMVELALAAIALIFWINAEPGLLRAFAFNVMLIGGVSTLLFNGNPLLRFDGYFVLNDILEIPNLGARSSKYFWYIVQRYVFGIKEAQSPVTAKGERAWFLAYSISAFIYRIFISIAIALFIASKLFFIGVILAIWAFSNVFVFPIFKGLKWLLASSSLRGRRRRAALLVGLFGSSLIAVIFLVPVPYATMAEGVVVLEDKQILRAETDGFVSDVVVALGAVDQGAVILQIEDQTLDAEVRLSEAQREELQMRLNSVRARDPIQVSKLREQLAFLDNRLALLEERRRSLIVHAPIAGYVVLPDGEDIRGRLVNKGAVLGYLLNNDQIRLRVAVPQEKAELVRSRIIEVNARLFRSLETVYPARLIAAAPESQRIIPSLGLATMAGGPFALDPSDPQQRRALRSLFVFDIELAINDLQPLVGERALIRFEHSKEPVGLRFFRSVRQLFLSQFNV